MSCGRDLVLNMQGLRVRSSDGRALVVDVDLEVEEGQVVGLVGETGSGKTLTARAALGLLPAELDWQARTCELAGREIRGMSDSQLDSLLGTVAGFVPQNTMTYLHPLLRVRDQLVDGFVRWHPGVSKRDAVSRARELVRDMGISDVDRVLSGYPGELSGGMRQRVNIAMALMGDPRIVVADEPTAALDAMTRVQVSNLLVGAMRQRGASLVLVSHDLNFIREHCDHVAVMYAGRIVESGPCREIVQSPAHPYTRTLLCSVPRLGIDRTQRLAELPGSMPEIGRDRSTCLFAPRCPMAETACFENLPPRKARREGDSHSVECLRAWEVADGDPRS